ncbi:hypothetical protein LQF12_11915 [Ruania suaedae]|uniref:hypothetical protein n=1 Tax=Ruania suaedae TaxID=2897774 RepID=UPI001E454089|nr:hypothetical protein [Ruania suaedae]UFU02211.1 hypothetical protein LQF12_11915 [Ruania suaedae]
MSRTSFPSVVTLAADHLSAPRAVRTVVVPGASAGGPAHLDESLIEVLIDIERRGLHTVLVAAAPADLTTSVAAICRYVLAADEQVLAQARAIWGSAQVRAVDSLAPADVDAVLRRLPVPASRTAARRTQAALQRVRRRARRAVRAVARRGGADGRLER